MIMAVYSYNGHGVIYDKKGNPLHVLTTERMYEPEPAQGVNISMWMQGPNAFHSELSAGEFPFREIYDAMQRWEQEFRAARGF